MRTFLPYSRKFVHIQSFFFDRLRLSPLTVLVLTGLGLASSGVSAAFLPVGAAQLAMLLEGLNWVRQEVA